MSIFPDTLFLFFGHLDFVQLESIIRLLMIAMVKNMLSVNVNNTFWIEQNDQIDHIGIKLGQTGSILQQSVTRYRQKP